MAILDIISLVLGGGSLVTLLIFLIKRHDERKDELKMIQKQLKKLEKDSVRTQLLLLMRTYTYEDEHELLQMAEYYFVTLKADWVLTAMFKRFLERENIATPMWFEGD